MDVLSRFPSTHRVHVKTSNSLMARRDMMRLSRIWSQLVGHAPILRDFELNDPLQILSGTDAERLCKFTEEGLHRCAYWTLSAETSANDREGAMGDEWWRDYEAKLNAIGSLHTEGIMQQLLIVGSKYINVPALESAIEAMKASKADATSEKVSSRHDSLTGFEEEDIAHCAPVAEQKATELQRSAGYAVQHVNVSSVAELIPQPAPLVRRWSTASKEAGANIVLPFRSLRLGNQAAIPAKGDQEESSL